GVHPLSDIPAELENVDSIHAAMFGDLNSLGKLVVGNAPVPLLDSDAQLAPGQMRSKAPVRSGSKRDVIVGRPVHHYRGGVGKAHRITGGGAERQEHHVTLFHGTSVEVDVLGDLAGGSHEGEIPQELLDRRWDE